MITTAEPDLTGLEEPERWTKRAEVYLDNSRTELAVMVDRMFVWLLGAEWAGIMAAAMLLSPRVWNGSQSGVHPHVWAAIFSGPAFIIPAIVLAVFYPGRAMTRHAVAVAQILVSVLLIDVTGGRIETHFHIFGSLAFLAFYRDWRVLVTATALTAADHVVRGIWWPESVYGILTVSPWRWAEHAGWVVFEDFFLFLGIRRSTQEMWTVSVSKAQLYSGAYHDVLTGLGNRRLLKESFESTGMAHSGSMRALLFIDLDRFKQANDTLGHAVGDKLLRQVASRLAAVVAPEDTLTRVGGDEFVVLLENVAGKAQALELASRLVEALSSPFDVEDHELLLSASVGISLSPEHGTDLATLQEKADAAMYVAKSRGRNQSAVFSDVIGREETELQEIGRDLYNAAARDELQLHFQPLVERTGELTGFEALLRWTHPVHGAISPTVFIPLAERSGLIVTMGHWVLREACRNCKTWQHKGQRALHVAVNVSAVQFEQPDYPERVAEALAEFSIEPTLLTLELTESVLLRDIGRARTQLSKLRATGIRIALDDFGTGYSSLSYLSTLPADTIKLDRTFVNREFANAGAVLQSVIDMAHCVGLRVVGEGVETAMQTERLSNMNCDELQGFYFSRPMPEGEVSGYIASSREDQSYSVEPAALVSA